MQSHRIELYGQVIELPAPKVFANSIHKVFNPIENNWHNKIINNFYNIFENLDEVYENSDKLARDVLSESVNAAMGILAKNSIYDVDEQKFIECYLSKYDVWDDHFEMVASQYESIIEETAQKDAYRTQRRLNRRKLVGFGPAPSMENGYRSPQQYADFSNAVDNIGHGIFNMMAKGLTAIGNSIKKDEIFKNPKTVKSIDSAVCSIILASKEAVVDALNERYDGAIHHYTKEEMQKASAIVTNVENGRIPKSDIKQTLLHGLQVFPYCRGVYALLLREFGSDGGGLDQVIQYFGMAALRDEKRKLIEAQKSGVEAMPIDGCKKKLLELAEYAKFIGYDEFDGEAKVILETAIKKEFERRRDSVNLDSVVACRANLPILAKVASEIGYQKFEAEAKVILHRAAKRDFRLEAGKYSLETPEDCETNLPRLKAFAKDVGFISFESWSAEVQEQAAKHAAEIAKQRNGARLRWAFILLIIGGIGLSRWVGHLENSESRRDKVVSHAPNAIERPSDAVVATPQQVEPQGSSEQNDVQANSGTAALGSSGITFDPGDVEEAPQSTNVENTPQSEEDRARAARIAELEKHNLVGAVAIYNQYTAIFRMNPKTSKMEVYAFPNGGSVYNQIVPICGDRSLCAISEFNKEWANNLMFDGVTAQFLITGVVLGVVKIE